jgi:formylglycine-generating enzyme required for sulfatase activity/uncharacterized caspase-like protein
MGRNFAITIGINDYDNLQSLSYAKRDAEAMRDYFLNEARFERVYHFAADAPDILPDRGAPLKAWPTFAKLERFLDVRFSQPFLESGDNFWFFFAGHGIRHRERDYLMPSDVNPNNVSGTAIAVNHIAERLRGCGADNVILILDACRNDDRAGEGIGNEQQKGVVTLFACSPGERSQEIDQLQQGAFTHTLLQGLRIQGAGNCATVERLDQHLRFQVPALNRRHRKPEQTPYTTAEPNAKRHLILLPKFAELEDVTTLKSAAWEAEVDRAWELAEHLWTCVLAASPADAQAIKAIKRLGTVPVEPMPARQNSQSGGRAAVAAPRSSSVSRRQLIQWIALGGGAVAAAVELPRLFSSTPTPTPTATPAAILPTSTPSSTPKPSPIPKPSPTASGGKLQAFEFAVITVNAKGEKIKEEKGKAESFKEDLGNGTTLEMVAIPGGEFWMGTAETDRRTIIQERTRGGFGKEDAEAWTGWEMPQHRLKLPRFCMGKFAITQAQWQQIARLPKIKRDLNLDPAEFKGANRPIEKVSWEEAVEFCDRLSHKAGKRYRLPSEAEWEYACRAGTTTPFHFGATITSDLANCDFNYPYGDVPKGKYREQTTDVGSFPANAFGLFDMHGNVLEWCADQWHENYQGAPADGSVWETGGDPAKRTVRGGSWLFYPAGCRSATRGWGVSDDMLRNLGFRVVCPSA